MGIMFSGKGLRPLAKVKGEMNQLDHIDIWIISRKFMPTYFINQLGANRRYCGSTFGLSSVHYNVSFLKEQEGWSPEPLLLRQTRVLALSAILCDIRSVYLLLLSETHPYHIRHSVVVFIVWHVTGIRL